MARRRGWGGNPPHDAAEATQRIVAAAVELIAETGRAITLGEVAQKLGVIRQTVYRYFPTADALMHAAAMASVDDFLDGLAAHVRGIHDPADAITEGTLYTLESVGRIPSLSVVLSGSNSYRHHDALASEEAQDFGMRMAARFDVDWAAHGYDEASLAQLVEFTLRIMMSYFVAPDSRPPDELRGFLRRWLGGAIAAQ